MDASREKLQDLDEAKEHVRALRRLYKKYPDALPEISDSSVVKLTEAVRALKTPGDKKPASNAATA